MTSVARWESLAICLHQSLLCPHRPMLGSAPRCQRAGVPNSAVCSCPPFFSASLFPLRPRLTLLCLFSFVLSPLPPTLFSSFPSVSPHLFSPPASHPSAPLLAAVSCSTRLPHQQGLVSLFFPFKRFRCLTLFQVFFINL